MRNYRKVKYVDSYLGSGVQLAFLITWKHHHRPLRDIKSFNSNLYLQFYFSFTLGPCPSGSLGVSLSSLMYYPPLGKTHSTLNRAEMPVYIFLSAQTPPPNTFSFAPEHSVLSRLLWQPFIFRRRPAAGTEWILLVNWSCQLELWQLILKTSFDRSALLP